MKQIVKVLYRAEDEMTFVMDDDGKVYSLWIDKSGDGQPLLRLVREKD